MATLDKQSLKQKFQDGATPTGADFGDLIDTIQSGTPSESAPPLPVSEAAAAAGTDTTGLVSPSGVKAYVDGQLATQAEAEAGTNEQKIMTPLRTKEAINAQVPSFREAAINTIRGGISSAYNTLQRLYLYITNSFYNRSQSDARYDKRTDAISGRRISSGISAYNISTGTLSSTRIPNLSASKISSGTLHPGRIPPLNANKINAGTINESRLPNIGAERITYGTLSTSRIPNLSASKITSGTIAGARIPPISITSLDANLRAFLQNSSLFFHYEKGNERTRTAGNWNVRIYFRNFGADNVCVYELFLATASISLSYILVVDRPVDDNGTIRVSSTAYAPGTSTVFSYGNSAHLSFNIADSTSTQHARIFYIKPVNEAATGGIHRLQIRAPGTTNYSTLSPLFRNS